MPIQVLEITDPVVANEPPKSEKKNRKSKKKVSFNTSAKKPSIKEVNTVNINIDDDESPSQQINNKEKTDTPSPSKTSDGISASASVSTVKSTPKNKTEQPLRMTSAIRDSSAVCKQKMRDIMKERHNATKKVETDIIAQKKTFDEVKIDFFDDITNIIEGKKNKVSKWNKALAEIRQNHYGKEAQKELKKDRLKVVNQRYEAILKEIIPIMNSCLLAVDSLRDIQKQHRNELNTIDQSFKNFVVNTLEDIKTISSIQNNIQVENDIKQRLLYESNSQSPDLPKQQQQSNSKKRKSAVESESDNVNSENKKSKQAASTVSNNVPYKNSHPDLISANVMVNNNGGVFRPLTKSDVLEVSLFQLFHYPSTQNPKTVYKRKNRNQAIN